MPKKSVIVSEVPVLVVEMFGEAAERDVFPPAQMVALVGVIVGAVGAGFTVITRSSVVFAQGLLLPIVQRRV